MKNQNDRLRRIELDLTPKDAAQVAIKKILEHGSYERYSAWLATAPSGKDPWSQAADNVFEKTCRQLVRTGAPRSDEEACWEGQREVHFFRFLFEAVSGMASSIEQFVKVSVSDLASSWGGEFIRRTSGLIAHASICQTPYPLDAETAAAVDSAFAHRVVPSRQVESDVVGWVLNDLAERGKNRLPRYLRRHFGVRSEENRREGRESLIDPGPMNELRALFGSDEALDIFLAGHDHRIGFPGMRDADVCTMLDAAQAAFSKLADTGVFARGIYAQFPMVSIVFLRSAPLIDGRWVDQVTVELAECGAVAISSGCTLEESADLHPLRTARICPREVHAFKPVSRWGDQMTAWRLEARGNLAKFPGKRKEIGNRPYIDLRDYLSWSGRKIRGSLQTQVVTEEGIIARSWESWVEDHGGFGKAKISGVTVGRIGFPRERPRFGIVDSIGDAAVEQQVRDAAASVQLHAVAPVQGLRHCVPVSTSGSKDTISDQFRSTWRKAFVNFVGSMFLFKSAISKIEQQYFDRHSIVFPDSLNEINRHLDFAHVMVGWFNFDICELPGWQGSEILEETTVKDELDELFACRGPIEMRELERAISPLVPQEVGKIVDAATISWHNYCGKAEQARVLIEKHRGDKSPFAKYWTRGDSAVPAPKESGGVKQDRRSARSRVPQKDEA